jgi:hypothetical protein
VYEVGDEHTVDLIGKLQGGDRIANLAPVHLASLVVSRDKDGEVQLRIGKHFEQGVAGGHGPGPASLLRIHGGDLHLRQAFGSERVVSNFVRVFGLVFDDDPPGLRFRFGATGNEGELCIDSPSRSEVAMNLGLQCADRDADLVVGQASAAVKHGDAVGERLELGSQQAGLSRLGISVLYSFPVANRLHDLDGSLLEGGEAGDDAPLHDFLTKGRLVLAVLVALNKVRRQGIVFGGYEYQAGFLVQDSGSEFALGVGGAGGAVRAIARADDADEEVALGDPGPAEIVGHLVDGAKVLHANAVVAVQALDGTIGGLAALHEVFAGGAEVSMVATFYCRRGRDSIGELERS